MKDYRACSEAFGEAIASAETITILSHVRPDADAIGTALGIYHWLRAGGKRVEVVNASEDLPRSLDFLPGFSRIKHRIDFAKSLIVACDSGSIDRLGFDLDGRTIVNIDHHPTNTHYGTLNCVDADAVASAQVAYGILEPIRSISPQTASAFYAALVSDTRNFTTLNMHAGIFDLAKELVDRGAAIAETSRQMLLRRSLASLRILGEAIASLELTLEGRVAVMVVRRQDRHKWGARGSDLEGIADYARSLVTVQVAALLVEQRKGVKVSLRSKGANVAQIAQHFGGGGHTVAAGYEAPDRTIESARLELIQYIQNKEIPI